MAGTGRRRHDLHVREVRASVGSEGGESEELPEVQAVRLGQAMNDEIRKSAEELIRSYDEMMPQLDAISRRLEREAFWGNMQYWAFWVVIVAVVAVVGWYDWGK